MTGTELNRDDVYVKARVTSYFRDYSTIVKSPPVQRYNVLALLLALDDAKQQHSSDFLVGE